jgi:hypothetical protein
VSNIIKLVEVPGLLDKVKNHEHGLDPVNLKGFDEFTTKTLVDLGYLYVSKASPTDLLPQDMWSLTTNGRRLLSNIHNNTFEWQEAVAAYENNGSLLASPILEGFASK